MQSGGSSILPQYPVTALLEHKQVGHKYISFSFDRLTIYFLFCPIQTTLCATQTTQYKNG